MNYQDRYDELENIDNTLGMLVDEITDKYYIDMLNQLRFEAQDELEEVSERLYEEENSEQRELENEFNRGRI
jgi:hypothetical protein